MIKQTIAKTLLAGSVVGLLSACSGHTIVPVTVQSAPLGATVLMQVRADEDNAKNADWIYLGTTPVDARRRMADSSLETGDTIVVRVFKDGFLDQQKSWSGPELLREVERKNTLFWNPKLVKAQ